MTDEDPDDETRPLLSAPPSTDAKEETSQVPYALLQFISAIIGTMSHKMATDEGFFLCVFLVNADTSLVLATGTAASLQQIIVGRFMSGLGAAGVTTLVAVVITGMSSKVMD
ncbi:hypothetical protein OEA41_005903 [Lepraria neglecta]|uniref:Uncharacterized protein n=1 Tax=Lepraria neglecta TaxID=209136 RepID=A0AAD9Z6W4_9LECA|nr:hypothetical protein OEA41_005903 [Lepraria neglecta]